MMNNNQIHLFRALTWEGEWVYGDLIHNATGDVVGLLEWGRNEYRSIRKETIGRFWKDVNGCPLYEGDIFDLKLDASHWSRFVVRHSVDYGCMCIINVDDFGKERWKEIEQWPSKNWWMSFEKCFIKTGNIFEHPYLLRLPIQL